MASAPYQFRLVAGRACLDFVNTLTERLGAAPTERLETFADLVRWARAEDLVSDAKARQLVETGRTRPKEAERVLIQARSLREAFFGIMTALTRGETPARSDLDEVSAALATALGHVQLVPGEQGYRLRCDAPGTDLDAVLWPIARSMGELLTSDDLARVRFCDAHSSGECAWVFLDETRNRTRRWCDMRECGNRAKARRHYHRKKAKES